MASSVGPENAVMQSCRCSSHTAATCSIKLPMHFRPIERFLRGACDFIGGFERVCLQGEPLQRQKKRSKNAFVHADPHRMGNKMLQALVWYFRAMWKVWGGPEKGQWVNGIAPRSVKCRKMRSGH